MQEEANFCCPVCQQEYVCSIDALQCPEKHGYSPKPKFKTEQEIMLNNAYYHNQKCKIIKISFSQPQFTAHNPHEIIYFLELSSGAQTTAAEKDICPA